jgi:anti-anti-sigma regulatory factor
MLLEISRMVRNQGGSMVLLSSSRTVARVLAILDPAAELPFSRSMADAQLEARQCPLTSTP